MLHILWKHCLQLWSQYFSEHNGETPALCLACQHNKLVTKICQYHLCWNELLAADRKWLMDNPIRGEDDIRFIRMRVAYHKMLLEQESTVLEEEENRVSGRDWRGNIPMLRLIHAVIEPDIKTVYLWRNDPMSRSELDARNSVQRNPTAFEMIAERWNATHLLLL